MNAKVKHFLHILRFLADGLRGPTLDGMDFTARNLQKPAKKLTNSAF